MQKAAGEVGGLAEVISDSVQGDDDEWIALVVAARAFVILVDRFSILDRAQDTYHRASTHQGNDENHFRACLDETGRLLSEIEPGLDGLKENIGRLDAAMGLDDDEIQWIEIQRRSLISHIEALKNLKSARPLIEFGGFLNRPAEVTQRLTWR